MASNINITKGLFRTIIGLHIKNFNYDAETFVQSKRFIRFEDLVEQNIVVLMKALAKEYDADMTTKFFVKDAILGYVAEKLSPSDKNISNGCSFTSYGILKGICPQVSALKMMMPCDGEDKITELYAEAMTTIAESTLQFDSIYAHALAKACYDFIQLKALTMTLTSENWYSELKNISAGETFFLLNRIFDNALSMTDKLSFLIMENQRDSFVQQLHSVNTYEEKIAELNRTIAELNDSLQAQAEQLKKRDGTIAMLNQQLHEAAQAAKTEENTALLFRKLKKKDAELEQLRQKYDELQAYADSLQQLSEDEQAYTEIPQQTVEELVKKLQSKRIVFVRDKKNENYDVMAKLAELFSNAKFTNCLASEVNADATDLMLVFTPYVCHSTYWSACHIAKKKHIPLIVLKNTNVNIIVQRINTFFELSSAV